MSDQLPSRDAVDEALTFAPLTDIAEDSIFDIARAYVSGRLFDREAIDRRAAIVAVAEGISDHISRADDWTEWETEATALVELALAAAIGDTDEEARG